MNYLKSFWEWLKSNGPILCLFVFLAAWVWSNAAMRQAEANNRKDAIACETLCFPQQLNTSPRETQDPVGVI